MSPDVWVPGQEGPEDVFVQRVHAQVAKLGAAAEVTIELVDGSLFELVGLSAEPGFGFVTLRPHPDDEDPEEVIVPLRGIAQIRLGKRGSQQRLGFSLPPG